MAGFATQQRPAAATDPRARSGPSQVKVTHLAAVALHADQLAPLLNGLGQVDGAQRQLHLTDLVVFGEPVEVIDGEH